MATDVKSTSEDAEMADCEEEKFVTMMDVLQDQEDIEEDANAVLGASDDKNCTYSKGYIKRQALYACLTCCSEAKEDPAKRAGVCLACSLTCHENHELIELYTKRNFKCDCGNPKFNSHPCQFTPNKLELNENNIYNQNFSGLYCICHRPYPDPESTVEEVMIQCIICEDWLHASHLEATVPANYLYSEMICKACMEKNVFLHDYTNIAVNSENIIVDVVTVNGIDIDKKTICNGDTELVKINNTMSKQSNEETLEANIKAEMTEMPKSNVFTSEGSVNNAEECTNVKNVPDTHKENTKENLKNEESNETKMESELEIPKLNSESTKVNVLPAFEEMSGLKCLEAENTIDFNKIDKTITKDIVKDSKNIESSTLSSSCANEKVFDSQLVNEEHYTGSEESTNKKDIIASITEIDKKTMIIENETKPAKTESESTVTESVDIPANIETVAEIESQALDTPAEPETNKNNEKSEEQIEEDKLLADPEDDIKKIDLADDAKESNKDNSNVQTSESPQVKMDRIYDTKSTMETDANTDANNDSATNTDLQKHKIHTEDVNIESKIINEVPIDNKTDKNITKNETLGGEDKTEPSVEVEIKDILFENNISNKTETVTAEFEPEEHKVSNYVVQDNQVEIELNNSEKISEKRKLSSEAYTSTEAKKPKLDEINCPLCVRPKHTKKVHKGATFWPSNFRQKLCTCRECISMYKDLAVLFLIDAEDTATAYENLGKQKIDGKPVSQYEKGLQALSSLDRVQQINALTEYNKMRDKLLDFLKSFKDRKEVVKEEDIKAFFAGMKPKREPDGVYFCR